MAWPFTSRAPMGTGATMIAERTGARRGRGAIPRGDALSHSAVWACRRLRADLVSSMPVDVFRKVGDLAVQVPKPPVLVNPDGKGLMLAEYLYASQNDLDDYGNTFAKIVARDGLGYPAVLEPVDAATVTVQVRKGVVTYKIGQDSHTYTVDEIWHERQYPASGSPVGLSPMAAAAASMAGYLSAQQFAADWFSGQTVPNAILRNQKRTLNFDEADVMKRRFKESQRNGDVFVTGADWDYSMINATNASASFIEERAFGLADICRFWGVPADMIDAQGTEKSSITYANITQRNLQLLVINLGPAVKRREDKLSQLTPAPRFVKLNSEAAVLRMDVKARYDSYATAIGARFLAPSEARDLENRPPFTPEQIAEFAQLAPVKPATPAEPPVTDPSGVSS